MVFRWVLAKAKPTLAAETVNQIPGWIPAGSHREGWKLVHLPYENAANEQTYAKKNKLAGGWTNPFDKICERQIGSFPQKVRGENDKNNWVATT